MVKTVVHGPPLNFRIHQDLLSSLLWGEKNEIGNEIRHMEYLWVLVPLKFARAFKNPGHFYVYYLNCGDGNSSVYRFPITQYCLH